MLCASGSFPLFEDNSNLLWVLHFYFSIRLKSEWQLVQVHISMGGMTKVTKFDPYPAMKGNFFVSGSLETDSNAKHLKTLAFLVLYEIYLDLFVIDKLTLKITPTRE